LVLDGESEGRGGEFPAPVGTAVVGDAAPGAGVEGEGEKEPAFRRFDVGEVALPDEAGPIRGGNLGQPVFGDGMNVAAVGGAGPEAPLLLGAQAAFPHEAGDAILTAVLAAVLEIEPHPWTTVGVPALLEALPDERAQLFVVLPTRTMGFAAMCGKAAISDFQRGGYGVGGLFGVKLFHQREVCGGISADKIPQAFF